jgi:hypothetical protein
VQINKRLALYIVPGLLVLTGLALFLMARKPAVETGPALPTFDYSDAGSWAVRPALPPPAVWENGWAVDVVVISASDALDISEKVEIEKRRTRAADELEKVAAAFAPIGDVYAPYLRAADISGDAAAALQVYLENDNRGRAFFIASDAPLAAGIGPVISKDPMVQKRFGGLFLYADGAPDESAAALPVPCARADEAGAGCVSDVKLRKAGGGYQASGTEAITDGFIDWLSYKAPKLAEPLGELEEIEVAPIQKPPER